MPDNERADGGISVHAGHAQSRLQAFGYQQQLDRKLKVAGSVALTLSDITPAGSLLVVGIAVVAVAGTGSVLAYIIGCFLAINVALCMAELGSVFPIAGGLYSIVSRVLGVPPGFLTLLNYIGQAIFLPASIALGIGTYLNALDPAIPVNISAAIAMAAVTVIALLRIRFNAVLTGVFLALEMIVIVVIAAAGFSHPAQPVSAFSHPVLAGGHGAFTAVGTSAVLAAVAIAMQSVNGYDAAIAFGEETSGSARNVGRAVLISCVLGIVLQLAAFIGAALGAPSLRGFLTSTTPLTYVVEQRWGHALVVVVSTGAIIAFFNATLAITLQFARILWASGRDHIWPGPVSRALAEIHPVLRTPWVATLAVGALSTILSYFSSLVAVVTFVSVLTIVLYLFIAVAAIVSRIRQRNIERPYRMRLWPAAPVISIVGVGLALSQQLHRDLIIVACIYLAGLLYYFGYLRPRKERFVHFMTVPSDDISPPAGQSAPPVPGT